MLRTRTSLDGHWDFQIDPSATRQPHDLDRWRTITVPSPWQAAFEDLRHTSGTAWYRRRIEVPPRDGAAVLHFGAVDYRATVWFNGVLLGEHEGGYLPFEFEVGRLLTGDDELLVRVVDPSDDPERYADGVFSEIPHGKQSWYGPLSGIWQSVWVEQRPDGYVDDVRIAPDLWTGAMAVDVTLSGPAAPGFELRAAACDADGREVAVERAPVTPGEQGASLALQVDGPRAWSPDDPYLYDVVVELVRDGEVHDRLVDRTGFRTIETSGGQLLLNGEPFVLRGALDQDYYPGTIASVPSVEYLEEQARRTKEFGLNCLRCHIKVPDPRYFEVADRFGLLVWAELPNWRRFTPAAADRARRTFEGMIARDGNHPSIVIWTIVNEDWGTDLVHEEAHRTWLAETYRWAKERDPSRLIVDNSACPPNFHVETDIEDYHFYRAIPDRRTEWDAFVDSFADRKAPTFSPHGDAVHSGTEPLIVSEFGNWGLPRVDLLREPDGRDPWWFATGDEWEGGIVRPQGIEERFVQWHLDRVFGDLRSFVEATQWQQFRALKYEIESIRRRPEIAGYVITELTDTHWEPNGLLDAHRRPKVFHDRVAELCGDTVVIPRWERVSYHGGQRARVGVIVATGARRELRSATVRWRLADRSGEIAVPDMAALDARELRELDIELPTVATSRREPLELSLIAGEEVVATNQLDLTIHAPSAAADHRSVWCADPVLAEHLVALGFRRAERLDQADVAVARRPTDELVRHVRAGGRALLLVDEPGELHPALPDLTAVDRRGGTWDGDWASTFAWLRRDGAAATLPGGPLLDEAFEATIPELVLDGVEPWEFESNVLAGIVVGWLHRPAGIAVRRHYGRGRVLATTFRLAHGAPADDPTAALLLCALVTSLEDTAAPGEVESDHPGPDGHSRPLRLNSR